MTIQTIYVTLSKLALLTTTQLLTIGSKSKPSGHTVRDC